jgi:uncharacterized protein (TIGR00369 family)
MFDKKTILSGFNKRCENTLMETLEIEYVDIGDGFLVAQMPVNSKVHQPYGLLHGGATAALAESVGSAASAFFVDSNKFIVKGIELTINHVKSIREGKVIATAKIIHKGRSTHLWEIRVVNESNELISISKLTNIILEKKQ